MVSRNFSGQDVVKALTKNRFFITDRTGSHVKRRYEHPHNEADVRIGIVPMHDSLDTGALHGIADQAGGQELQAFCTWIERNS